MGIIDTQWDSPTELTSVCLKSAWMLSPKFMLNSISTYSFLQLPTADMCTDCKMFFGDVQKELMDPNNQVRPLQLLKGNIFYLWLKEREVTSRLCCYIFVSAFVSFQQTIIMAVEQVCSLLGDLSSECQSLVEQYGSTVINALAQILVSWIIKFWVSQINQFW